MITGGKQVHTSSLKPESLFYGKMHTRNGGKKRKKKKRINLINFNQKNKVHSHDSISISYKPALHLILAHI